MEAPLVHFTAELSTLIVTAKPGVFGTCGRPSFCFVNRNGETRCLLCDEQALGSQKEAA
jgi:hypothetical protein